MFVTLRGFGGEENCILNTFSSNIVRQLIFLERNEVETSETLFVQSGTQAKVKPSSVLQELWGFADCCSVLALSYAMYTMHKSIPQRMK